MEKLFFEKISKEYENKNNSDVYIVKLDSQIWHLSEVPEISFPFTSIYSDIMIFTATYNDYRCKCICNLPSKGAYNSTLTKKVYIQSVESENCRCPYMMPDIDERWCPRCECKYQNRKTKIIQVVVWIVISIISSLTFYMVMLYLLETFCKRKTDTHFLIKMDVPSSVSSPGAVKIIKQHEKISSRNVNTNEVYHPDDLPFASHDELQDVTSEDHVTCRKSDGPITTRVRTKSEAVSDVVNRARLEQDRWRGNVKIQRERVFNEHTLLN